MSAEGKKKDKGFIALLVLIIVCACLMIAAVTTLGVGMSQGFGGSEGPTGEQTLTTTEWFSGDGVPSGNIGKKGDFYLNKQNGDVYEKTDNGWQPALNIKGADADTVPRISNGENGEVAGNWYIGSRDTGVKAGGSDGLTPSIGADGYWYIGGKKTDQRATHELTYEDGQWYLDGEAVGEPAAVPHIGDGDKGEKDGYWYIGDVCTEIKAEAESVIPYIGSNGNWWVGETDTHQVASVIPTIDEADDGEFHWFLNGVDTGFPVQGLKGADGNTPYIGRNGNWYIDGVDQGVSAKSDAYIDENGYWVVGGKTTEFSCRPAEWHSGEGAPTNVEGEEGLIYVQANNGDYYVDTLNGAIYRLMGTTKDGVVTYEWTLLVKAQIELVGNEWVIFGKHTQIFVTQWYAEEGEPGAQKFGYKGDYYINLNNGDIYINEGKNADANGKSSSWKKLTNFAGGNANVTSWRTGTVDPTVPANNVQGLLGDMYLNTQSGQVYQYGLSGWAAINDFVLNGTKAVRGTRLFSGKGTPAENQDSWKDAVTGDYYFDTKSGIIYVYTDTTTGWSALNADDPLAGTKWLNGDVDPAHADLAEANEGDVYFNTSDRTLWQLVGETWQKLGQIASDSAARGTKWFYGSVGTNTDAFKALVEEALEGDFYLQTYYAFSGKEGFTMYTKHGNVWNVVLDMYNEITPSTDYEYKIPNYDALVSFRDSVNGKYDNTANDYGDETIKLTGAVTIPEGDTDVIGSLKEDDTYYVFKGTLDGGMAGLAIDSPKGDKYIEGINGTLFGHIEDATIQNLDLYGTLNTDTLTTEGSGLSLLKNTFGLAEAFDGTNNKISNVRLTLESEVATVVVYWASDSNVSVTVTGKTAEVQATAANSDASTYKLSFIDKKFDLAEASYTFDNIALTGDSYFNVDGATGFALKNSYVATNQAPTTVTSSHNAPIYGNYNHSLDTLVLEGNIFTSSRAVYMYNNVKSATISGNSFGTESGLMADEWAVKFMSIGYEDTSKKAEFVITGNTVYGETTTTGDNGSFYAFDFFSDEEHASYEFNAKFENNEVYVTDNAAKGDFGIVKIESEDNHGGKGQFYFVKDTNKVDGLSIYEAVKYDIYQRGTEPVSGADPENSFNFIAFDAEFAKDSGFGLVKGNVYIGEHFGSNRGTDKVNKFDAAALKTLVEDDVEDDVSIIDLAYSEDPTGFVQHVADYEKAYYINSNQGYVYFLNYLETDEGKANNNSGMTYGQTADLDMDVVSALSKSTDADWTPAVGTQDEPFKATYDGGNNTITNLTCALFGYTKGAEIKSLTISGSVVSGKEYVGALIGVAQKGATTNKNTTVTNVTIKDADLTLTGPYGADNTATMRSIGAIAGAADGITLSAVKAENVTIDNLYSDNKLNFIVYNNGLVGSKYVVGNATSDDYATDGFATGNNVLKAADVVVDAANLLPGEAEFTASFEGYISALSLNLLASWSRSSAEGAKSTAVWTLKNVQGLRNVETLVENGFGFAGDTVVVGVAELDLSNDTTWSGIGTIGEGDKQPKPFKGTFSGIEVGTEGQKALYSHITGLKSALFNNINGGTVKDLVLSGLALTKTAGDNATLNGLVATKLSGNVTFDGVSVSATAATAKASELAAAPYALYSGVENEATVTVKNSYVDLTLQTEKIDFTATIDADSVSDVTFKGDKSMTLTDTFSLRGFNDPASVPPAGVESYDIIKPLGANYTFEGLKFGGSSYLDIAYASGLTMKNCEADVTYSAKEGRMAFIRANKDPQADNAFGALKLDIENNTILVSTKAENGKPDGTNYPNAIYVMWNALQNGSVIKGNTLGSAAKPLPHDAIKLSEFANNAVITIESNTIYGTTNDDSFTAFNFVQAKATADTQPATLKLNANNVYVVTEKEVAAEAGKAPTVSKLNDATDFMLLQIEGYCDSDRSAYAYAYFKTYLDAQNKIFTGKKLLNNSVTYAAQGAAVKYEDINIDCKNLDTESNVENELALFVGYNVEWADVEVKENNTTKTVTKIVGGDFVFGQDTYLNGTATQTGNSEKFSGAVAALKKDVADTKLADAHIVIGNDFGRRLSDLAGTNSVDNTYYIFNGNAGLNTFKSLVEANYSFSNKTVKLTGNIELPKDKNWEPIGTTHAFNGTFDGTSAMDKAGNPTDTYSISGLTYKGAATSFGFFAQTTAEATISNVTFSGASITMNDKKEGTNYVGVVVAQATDTTFQNVLVSGSTFTFGSTEHDIPDEGSDPQTTHKATYYANVEAVGAVAGLANGGTFTGITVKNGVTITSEADVKAIGGVVGKAQNTVTLNNIYVGVTAVSNPAKDQLPYAADATSPVVLTGKAAVGGVVGVVDTSATVTVGGDVAATDTTKNVYVGATVKATEVKATAPYQLGGIVGVANSTTNVNNTVFLGTLSREFAAPEEEGEKQFSTTVYANYGLVGVDAATLPDNNINVTIRNSEINSTPVTGYTQSTKWASNGNVTSVYYISNEAGLKFFAEQVNGGKNYAGEKVQLTSNITLQNAWTPIGTEKTPFNGIFTGCNNVALPEEDEEPKKGAEITVGNDSTGYYFSAYAYTISGLTVNTHPAHNGTAATKCTDESNPGNYAGLFGVTGDKAEFSYINISGATVNGREYVGTLVGMANGATFDNITIANATVNGHHFVGGLAGHAIADADYKLTNVQVVGLNAAAYPNDIGDSKIDNGDDVGGLLGYLGGTSATIGETGKGNVVANSTLQAYRDIGGLVGTDDVTTSGATYTANTVKDVTIKIVRSNYPADYLAQASSYVGSDTQYAEWLVGRPINNSNFYDDDAAEKNTMDNVTVLHDGFVKDNGVYHISDLASFKDFVSKVSTINSADKVVLDDDLSLVSENNFTPIAEFKGTFDGRGHTISNVTVTGPSNSNAGLFTSLNGATVKNLNLVKVTVTASGDTVATGALAGTATNATITNVTLSDATVTATGTNAVAGGLIGKVLNGTKTELNGVTLSGNTAVSVKKSATDAEKSGIAGGLIGQVSGATELKAILMGGEVEVNGATAGGVIGSVDAALTVNATPDKTDGTPIYTISVNNVRVHGTDAAGSFAGQMTVNSTVQDVYFTAATVEGYDVAAGFIGVLNTPATFSGITVNGTVEARKEPVAAGENNNPPAQAGGTVAGFATYGTNVSASAKVTIDTYKFVGEKFNGANKVYLKGEEDGVEFTANKVSRVVITANDMGDDTDGFFFGATSEYAGEGLYFIEYTSAAGKVAEVNGLKAFADTLTTKDYEGEEVVLLTNVTLAAWTSPAATSTFKGTFNGNNMTITLENAKTYETLFGTVEGKLNEVPAVPPAEAPTYTPAENIKNLTLKGLGLAKELKVALINGLHVELGVNAKDCALYGLVGAVNAEKAEYVEVKSSDITVDCTDYNAKFEWDDKGVVKAAEIATTSTGVAFTVKTAEGLRYLAQVVNSGIDYATLTVEIVKSTTSTGAVIDLAGAAWTPIGTNATPFKGTFNGNNATIKNLSVTESAASAAAETPKLTFAGLFGYVYGGEVKDLKVENVTLSANVDYAGTVAGWIGGTSTLSGITVTGNIYVTSGKDNAYVGGIAGYMENVTLGNITVTGNGKAESATVKSSGTASGAMAVGGIAGMAISVTSNENTKVEVTNMIIDGSRNVGGFFGIVSLTVTINEATFEGVVGSNSNKEETNGLLYGTKSFGGSFIATAYTVTLHETDGFTSKFKKTTDADTKTVEISTVDGLKYFRNQIGGGRDFAGYTVTLAYNIYQLGEIAPNGGTFSGTFGAAQTEGADVQKPIIVYTMNSTFDLVEQVGFFGKLDGATVSNLVFRNVQISATANSKGVGIVAASAKNSTISGVVVDGNTTVEGGIWVGGLVGYATNVTLDGNTVGTENKATTLTVLNFKLGGLAGYLNNDGAETDRAVSNNALTNVALNAAARSLEGADNGYGMIGGLIGGSDKNGTTNITGNKLTNVTIDATKGDANYQKYTGALVGNPGGGSISSNVGAGDDDVIDVTIKVGPAAAPTAEGLVGANADETANYQFGETEDENSNTLSVKWINNIENDGDLLTFAKAVNDGDNFGEDFRLVSLNADVNLENYVEGTGKKGAWTPIGTETNPFKGTFEGNGKTISKLTVTGEENVGFFGVLAGTVQNLKFTDAKVTATSESADKGICVGVLAGKTTLNEAINIKNVTIKSVEVSGKDYVSALVGQIGHKVTITGCTVSETKITVTAGALHFSNLAKASSEASKKNVSVNPFIVGGNTSATVTENETIYANNTCEKITVSVALVEEREVPADTNSPFEDVLSIVNYWSGCLTKTTITLAAGTYKATADDLFVIKANNVTLQGTMTGSGNSATIGTTIDCGAYKYENLGAFVVMGNNVTIKNVNITSSITTGSTPTLKVAGTVSNSVPKPVTGFTLENAKVTAASGNAIDLHTVENATISNVTVEGYTKCGIALAQATNVYITNVTFKSATTGSWAEIGIMFDTSNPNNPNYAKESTVTVNLNTLKFEGLKSTATGNPARKATIYSERPASKTLDSINNGTKQSSTPVNSGNVPNGWKLTEKKDATSKVTGWELVKD